MFWEGKRLKAGWALLLVFGVGEGRSFKAGWVLLLVFGVGEGRRLKAEADRLLVVVVVSRVNDNGSCQSRQGR